MAVGRGLPGGQLRPVAVAPGRRLGVVAEDEDQLAAVADAGGQPPPAEHAGAELPAKAVDLAERCGAVNGLTAQNPDEHRS